MSNEEFTEIISKLSVFSWIGWYFFFKYFVEILQKLFYQIRKHITGVKQPSVNSKIFFKDKQKISFILTFIYLIYTICGFYRSFSKNFYEILEVSPYYYDKQKLKTQFRKMALKLHPDKMISKNLTQFIELRLAYNVLSNTYQRFAYERLGPSAIEWSNTVSMSNILFQSIKPTIHFYGGIMLIFFISNLLNLKPRKKFWHFYGLSVWFILEIIILVRSCETFPFNYLFPKKLPFEFLNAIHTIIRVFLLTWSNIELILYQQENDIDILTSSKKISSLSSLLLNETTNLLDMEYSCYTDNSDSKDRIKKGIKDVLIRLTTVYPLPPFRCWHFIPVLSDSMTIQHLIEHVIETFCLKIEPHQLSLELEGFNLPLKAPVCKILRENDLVVLKQVDEILSIDSSVNVTSEKCLSGGVLSFERKEHNKQFNTINRTMEQNHNHAQYVAQDCNFKRKAQSLEDENHPTQQNNLINFNALKNKITLNASKKVEISTIKTNQTFLVNNENRQRAPPGKGLASTKARNMRKKRTKKLLKLKQQGILPESATFVDLLKMEEETNKIQNRKNIEIKPLRKYIKNKSKGFISKIGNNQSKHIKFDENGKVASNNETHDQDWRNRCILKEIECELPNIPVQHIFIPSNDNTKEPLNEALSPEMPSLPDNIETLTPLNQPPSIGSIIAFKHLSMSNNYEPVLSGYKTAKILDISALNVLILQLAKRDQKKKEIDPETGEYIYGKFGVDTDVEKDGQLVLAWDNLISPVLLQK
ncbi:hypothetical protein PCK1_001703 [Pneumocystis canis]|nr:hypothetical protein PCK1_001703 [Pneumocystis canis]